MDCKQSQKALDSSEKHGPGKLECNVKHPSGGMA